LLRTVVIEPVKVDIVGFVVEVDERLAVSPALHYNAAWLRIERKKSSVEMTWSVHHSAEPPPHPASVVQMHSVDVVVALRVEVTRAGVHNDTNNDTNCNNDYYISLFHHTGSQCR